MPSRAGDGRPAEPAATQLARAPAGGGAEALGVRSAVSLRAAAGRAEGEPAGHAAGRRTSRLLSHHGSGGMVLPPAGQDGYSCPGRGGGEEGAVVGAYRMGFEAVQVYSRG